MNFIFGCLDDGGTAGLAAGAINVGNGVYEKIV
jgi:hypothetical protein